MSDALHELWRRPCDYSRAIWQKAPGVAPATKSELMLEWQRQLWIVSEIEYEYAIVPVGERPAEHGRFGHKQEPFSQTYRTKEMRPR